MKWKEENRPLSPSEIYFGKRIGLIQPKPTPQWPFPPADLANGLPLGGMDFRDAA